MYSIANLQETQVILNRFLVKKLTEEDRRVYEYTCSFSQLPDPGKEFRAISSICYKLGVPATRLGNKIITRRPVNSDRLKRDDWEVQRGLEKTLSPSNNNERRALEQLERKVLEESLVKQWNKTAVERSTEGGLIWWITGDEGKEKYGNGWEVHRGRKVDVSIDVQENFFLEIDLHHRFYTPWTLHEWQDEYPDTPIDYVRNTYRTKNNEYLTWRYEGISEETPNTLVLENLGQTLAEYHRQLGATEDEIQNSRVVYVKRANSYGNTQSSAHLSRRLSPSLTMEMLASIAENSDFEEKRNVQEVFEYIRKSIDIRFRESEKAAYQITQNIYKLSSQPEPITVTGLILPKGKLYGKKGEVSKTGEVRYKGFVKVGEDRIGCLNLFNEREKYPSEVEKCLREVGRSSDQEIELELPRTSKMLPKDDLDRQIFWQDWSETGIKTILVIAPWLTNDYKTQIRVEALQAGIATQFMLPLPKADSYKAMNVVLGLLAKAAWQAVRLELVDHPQAADLIIGFDTGTNRELYYGTSAFAVLADGQSLGWELPDVQRGERLASQAVWQTVSKLILKFHDVCKRYPKRVLLMRDGLVQEGEFDRTITALEQKDIAVDLVGVRKSGSGRMGREILQKDITVYRDAEPGTVVFMPEECSFLLVTTQPINQNIGSVRPLRVIHEHGDASLEVLALQAYHLTKLHPASGFRSCRLPWVLHLADRNSKEFQRIGQIGVLQNLNREKLIAV